MTITDYAKSFTAITTAVLIAGGLIGTMAVKGVALASDVKSIKELQQSQVETDKKVDNIEETVGVIDRAQDTLISNQNTMWERQQVTDGKIDEILGLIQESHSD